MSLTARTWQLKLAVVAVGGVDVGEGCTVHAIRIFLPDPRRSTVDLPPLPKRRLYEPCACAGDDQRQSDQSRSVWLNGAPVKVFPAGALIRMR